MTLLLAGDVGGTKTTLGVFSVEKGPREPLVRETVSSGAYPGLGVLCRTFLDKHRLEVRRASFGVPGPIRQGVARATNLPWDMAESSLAGELGVERVSLMNDLAAVAHGIPQLAPEELHTVREGDEDPEGVLAVLAPGTGLGEAFATRAGGRIVAHPSEGGHGDFAPTTARQAELLAYLGRTFHHVSYERVCSGMGFPNLYAFLRDRKGGEEPPEVADALRTATDPTPVLLQRALDPRGPCPVCTEALDLFVEILGAKAGNLALGTMATGGVFLGGGLPPRILDALSDGRFENFFLSKGRLRPFLEEIPIRVILNPDAPFLGAACRGLEDMDTQRHPA
jgi:glucokinase